jgi:hypothetical protein
MTFFNIIVHGVPDGQKVWSSDPIVQANYIEGFYNNSNSNAPANLFQVEARVEGNTRVCYYHYLKYRDIQAKDGRTGSYLGFTLRIDAMCADLPLLFHRMDEVFRTDLLNTVLAATPNGYKHLVSDYAERKNELDTLVEEFSMWLSKPRIKELFGTLPQFPGAKQKSAVLNLEDFSTDQAVLNVLSKGFILCLSPDVPRSAYIAEKKQLQNLLEQKDAQREALLKQEQEKSRQEVATLRDKNNELSHEVARLRDNEKLLSQKVGAKEEILRLLENLRKDIRTLLQNLAIYLGKGSAKKPGNGWIQPASCPGDGEHSKEISGYKANKADRQVAFPSKNKNAIYRLLILLVAILLAFGLGRFSCPCKQSNGDDSAENSGASFQHTIPAARYNSVPEQDFTVGADERPSTEEADERPSTEDEKKRDDSESSHKKNKRSKKSSNKGRKESSEQAEKSSSAE